MVLFTFMDLVIFTCIIFGIYKYFEYKRMKGREERRARSASRILTSLAIPRLLKQAHLKDTPKFQDKQSVVKFEVNITVTKGTSTLRYSAIVNPELSQEWVPTRNVFLVLPGDVFKAADFPVPIVKMVVHDDTSYLLTIKTRFDETYSHEIDVINLTT